MTKVAPIPTPRQIAAATRVRAAAVLIRAAQDSVDRAHETLAAVQGMATAYDAAALLCQDLERFRYLLEARARELGDALALDRDPDASVETEWQDIARNG